VNIDNSQNKSVKMVNNGENSKYSQSTIDFLCTETFMFMYIVGIAITDKKLAELYLHINQKEINLNIFIIQSTYKVVMLYNMSTPLPLCPDESSKFQWGFIYSKNILGKEHNFLFFSLG